MVVSFAVMASYLLSLDALSEYVVQVFCAVILAMTCLSVVLARGVKPPRQGVSIDALTGLVDRAFLCQQVSDCLTGSKGSPGAYTLGLVNLDRFKMVNVALGYDDGDSLLRIYGQMLIQHLPDTAVVGRLTCDEFGFIVQTAALSDLRSSPDAMIEKFRALLALNIELRPDVAVTLSSSIGYTQFPLDERDTAMSVLRRADTALLSAKRSDGGCAREFLQPMGLNAERKFSIETDLRLAIANDELTLFLQSQVDMAGNIISAECLVRWCHPSKGLLLPGEFLDVAEESDLIVDLGSWVIERAFRLQVLLEGLGHEIRLSVNVSPRQFFKADFVDRVRRTLELTGANPRLLTFEITESLVIKDIDVVVQKMRQLVDSGFRFSLDDFGTGYSSLSYLKVLPVQEIKIARSFITDAPHNRGDAALVRAMVSVAENLSLQVVAEGVETHDQNSFLEGLGSMLLQGFLFSRPLPHHIWIDHLAEKGWSIPTHQDPLIHGSLIE